jgi:poly(A)-specific ribonuclease
MLELIIALDIDPKHGKYLNTKPLHEAGYDSLLTAQILIKLSTQLNSNFEKPTAEVESNLKTFSAVYRKTLHDGIEKGAGKTSKSRKDSTESLMQFSPRSGGSSIIPPEKYPSQQPIDWTEPTEFDRIRSAFAHKTRFDLLTDQTEEIPTFPLKGDGHKGPPSITSEESLLRFPEDIDVEQKVAAGDLIPRFGSKFWSIYGNKLRVFGTEESVCILNS